MSLRKLLLVSSLLATVAISGAREVAAVEADMFVQPSLPSSAAPLPAFLPGGTHVIVPQTGTTAAMTFTMPAVAGVTNFICGYTIDANATAATSGTGTITGILGGTVSFMQNIAATPGVTRTAQNFRQCLPASAQNVAIVLASVAPGAGGVENGLVWGYQQ